MCVYADMYLFIHVQVYAFVRVHKQAHKKIQCTHLRRGEKKKMGGTKTRNNGMRER